MDQDQLSSRAASYTLDLAHHHHITQPCPAWVGLPRFETPAQPRSPAVVRSGRPGVGGVPLAAASCNSSTALAHTTHTTHEHTITHHTYPYTPTLTPNSTTLTCWALLPLLRLALPSVLVLHYYIQYRAK
ncbi:hypothetical protein H112_01959 [Trichophyton rubrum D6]|uniref:Uncharacterized protein n=3 Tax=Trichophyton TaxID=5550 RepID=A0A080WNL4_TRIRC|nr:uncharacterized protein TERG_12443 [Trichophyton rubrum CBS 118892]EZF25766.1 hypothetical protein H100_01955 [Trichophyton rubrum MR850]EZF44938.1 hypothetical protein H102_01954 [Trichophyton rubrum CBS 100081]EZF55430.1 hypothetical protein H103_01965 [Trichophyton rubrum CBS 288.86]EZF66171.1 hypothetical protein H104_01940 [Trichophyton rubrum CBS 289.86]EZF76791.1 hypothetical protein H105_01969 [Trichophyton soudanense CBS 452.61]EZF87339.1 hypothetical protein H110_01964 [Trichophy